MAPKLEDFFTRVDKSGLHNAVLVSDVNWKNPNVIESVYNALNGDERIGTPSAPPKVMKGKGVKTMAPPTTPPVQTPPTKIVPRGNVLPATESKKVSSLETAIAKVVLPKESSGAIEVANKKKTIIKRRRNILGRVVTSPIALVGLTINGVIRTTLFAAKIPFKTARFGVATGATGARAAASGTTMVVGTAAKTTLYAAKTTLSLTKLGGMVLLIAALVRYRKDETLLGRTEVFGKKVPPMPPVLRSIEHMVGEKFSKIFGKGESSTFSKIFGKGESSARAGLSKIFGRGEGGSSTRAGTRSAALMRSSTATDGKTRRAEVLALLQDLEQPMVTMNRSGEVTFWNKGAMQLSGIPAESAVGHALPCAHADDHELIQDVVSTALSERKAVTMDLELSSQDDSVVMWSLAISPLELGGDADADEEDVLLMITDVTSIDQQKKAALMEAVRLEFRDELVSPLLGTHNPVFAIDQNGAVMLWNDSAASMTGRSCEEMLGKTSSVMVTAVDQPKLASAVQQVQKTMEPVTVDVAMQTKSAPPQLCTVSLFWSAIFGPSSVVAMCTIGGKGGAETTKSMDVELAKVAKELTAAKHQVTVAEKMNVTLVTQAQDLKGQLATSEDQKAQMAAVQDLHAQLAAQAEDQKAQLATQAQDLMAQLETSQDLKAQLATQAEDQKAHLETEQDLKAQLAAMKAQLAAREVAADSKIETPRSSELRVESEQQAKEIAGLMDTLAQMGAENKKLGVDLASAAAVAKEAEALAATQAGELTEASKTAVTSAGEVKRLQDELAQQTLSLKAEVEHHSIKTKVLQRTNTELKTVFTAEKAEVAKQLEANNKKLEEAMTTNAKLDKRVEEMRKASQKVEVRVEEVDLELDEAQQYLQLEQAAECAFILDCDMCVELWNAAAARTTGRTRGEVVGKPLRDILTSNKVESHLKPALDGTLPLGNTAALSMEMLATSGTPLPWVVIYRSYLPVEKRGGKQSEKDKRPKVVCVVDHRKTSGVKTPRGEGATSPKATSPKATSPKAESTDPVIKEFEAHGIVDVKKIREGVYVVNGKQFNVQVKNDKMMVRVGGGFTPLEKFLEETKVKPSLSGGYAAALYAASPRVEGDEVKAP